MPSRMSNITNLFSDQKTRTIVIFTGVILISMVIWGLLHFTDSTKTQESQSKVAGVPNIESVPDPSQQLSPQMAQNIKASDAQRIKAAQQTGQSALPTLIPQAQNQQPQPDLAVSAQNEGQGQGQGKRQGSQQSQVKTDATDKQTITANQLAQLSSQLAQSQQALSQAQAQASAEAAKAQQAAQQAALQEAQKKQQQMSKSMQNQAQVIFGAWSGKSSTSKQAYVEGDLAKPKNEQIQNPNTPNQATGSRTVASTSEEQQSQQAQQKKPPASIKAGDLMFGILTTAVNSDEPGPILAVVASGKYRGAKLVGKMQQSPEIKGTNGPTTVILTFNTMNVKGLPNTVNINAIAVDPDTARTALASEVDHHRLYRYGTLFASSFLSGYGNAISSSGSVTFNNTDGSQTTFQQELNPTETFLAALGEVGTELGDALSSAIDRPNTIYVNSGTSLGILFLSDVTVQDMMG